MSRTPYATLSQFEQYGLPREYLDKATLSVVRSAGTTPPRLSVSGVPVSAMDVIVLVTTGGAIGTMKFKYSVDGGTEYSSSITSAATNALGSTGIVLTWAVGTYTTDNTYRFLTLTQLEHLISASDEIDSALRAAGFGTPIMSPSNEIVLKCCDGAACSLANFIGHSPTGDPGLVARRAAFQAWLRDVATRKIRPLDYQTDATPVTYEDAPLVLSEEIYW